MKKMDQIIADYNSIGFKSFMSEDEKWFFDTHGYIIVKNVLSKEKADYLIDKFEKWRSMPEKEIPAPVTISPNKNVFQNIHYVEKLYHDLVVNDLIMKYVSSVLLHNPRLMFTSVIRLKKDEKRPKIVKIWQKTGLVFCLVSPRILKI